MDSDNLLNFTPSVFWWQGFINSMLEFSCKRLKTDTLSDIIDDGLAIFSKIPNAANIVFYELTEGEFIFSKELKINTEYEFNHSENFSILIEKNIVATVLTAGNVFYQKSDLSIIPKFNVLILPLFFSSKIFGIILVYIDDIKFNLDNISLNLISSHSHQFTAYLNNYFLHKEIKNLNSTLSQKISIKTLEEKRKRIEITKILDSINSAVLIIDRDTDNIIKTNVTALKILECEADDILNKKRSDFIDNLHEQTNWIYNYSKGNFETTIVTPHKHKLEIITSLTEISIDGKIYLLESFIDITNVKITKNTLKRHTDLLIGLSDSTQSLLSIQNIEQAIDKAISILGKATDCDRVLVCKNNFETAEMSVNYEWLNKNISGLKNHKIYNKLNLNRPAVKNLFDQLKNEKSVKIKLTEFNERESKYFTTNSIKSLLAVPIKFDGEFWGVIGLNDCNSEREWSEIEEKILKAAASSIGGIIQKERYIRLLEKAKLEAEKSDKIKSDFLTQISHEIRTPLNTILNFSNLIEMEVKDNLDQELLTYFDSVRSAGARIVRTIDLILNMSEIQNGKYSPSTKKIDIYDTVQQIYHQLKPQAQLKKLDFRLSNFNRNIHIYSDDYALNQIFSNLIDNAIKFTEQGKVVVEFSEQENFYNIEVKDTGIGISEEYIPHLFTPFSQEERGYTRRYEGNGLGLALAKQYCNFNNIHLSYSTKKDLGTTFIVSIPKVVI